MMLELIKRLGFEERSMWAHRQRGEEDAWFGYNRMEGFFAAFYDLVQGFQHNYIAANSGKNSRRPEFRPYPRPGEVNIPDSGEVGWDKLAQMLGATEDITEVE